MPKAMFMFEDVSEILRILHLEIIESNNEVMELYSTVTGLLAQHVNAKHCPFPYKSNIIFIIYIHTNPT